MSDWTDSDWEYANSEMYKTVMESVTMTLENWIMSALSAGKTIEDIAKEYECSVDVVKEYAELKQYLDERNQG